MNKKYIAIIIAIIFITTAFIGIHIVNNNTNVDTNNNNFKINVKPYINSNITPEFYSLSIYIEKPSYINYTETPYKYNVNILNKTLPFKNNTLYLNNNIIKNVSEQWYNNLKSSNNIVNYISNKNSLSMQLYGFAFINKDNKTYVYSYFNNILYNPINIINTNSFNYNLSMFFNYNNPVYVFSGNNTNNTPESITPGPGSNCCVHERKVCDYNHDHSYTQELNQTTYKNSYLPVSIMNLHDANNNTDIATYSSSISEFNSSKNVNFKFNDTTTYSSTDTVQSTTPSYISPDLSVNDITLVAEKQYPVNIYGIPNATLQLTNYRSVIVTDYKYTLYLCFYKNGEEVRHSSSTHSEDHTNYGNPYGTLKVLSAGSGVKDTGFSISNKTQREYIYAIGFYQYLLKDNTEILNKTLNAGNFYSVSTLSLNVTTYTNAYDTLNKVLTAANLFLGGLGLDLAIMSVSAAAFDLGGAAGYVLAAASLVAAAGSLGIAIAQAAQPLSVAENINGQFNTMSFNNENIGTGAPFNFVLYKSEYPENIEYSGAYHTMYVPEPYIYVT